MSCFVSLDRYASMCLGAVGRLGYWLPMKPVCMCARLCVCFVVVCVCVGGCRMYRYLRMGVFGDMFGCVSVFFYVFFRVGGYFFMLVCLLGCIHCLKRSISPQNLYWHRAISDRKRKVILGHKSEPRCADTCTEFPFKNPNEQR